MSSIITAAVVMAFILASIGVGEQGMIDEYYSNPHCSHVPLIQGHQHTGGTYVVYKDLGDPGTRDPVWDNSPTSISLASSGFDRAEKKATEATFSQPEGLSLSEKHLDQMTYILILSINPSKFQCSLNVSGWALSRWCRTATINAVSPS